MNKNHFIRNRAAILLMTAVFFYGVIYNAWSLFLNLYILARGLNKEFLGLANIMPAAAALILGIPLGLLSDKIGQKKAMLIGLTSCAAACAVMSAVEEALAIMAASFLWGCGSTLFTISLAPFMMKISDEGSRLALFSINGSLQIISGVFGNYLAGLVPGLVANWFSFSEVSPEAYQAVFLFSAVIGFIGLGPIILIRNRNDNSGISTVRPTGDGKPLAVDQGMRAMLQARNLKLLAPNFIIGAGAGLLIPYLNVFYMEQFGLGNEALGFLFSLSSLITGAGILAGPRLAKWCGGKVKVVVLTQAFSLGFMLLTGFSKILVLSSIGFLLRAMLINIAPPVWSAFVMEQTDPGRQGTMSSFQNLVWTAGWFCGPYLSGLIQERYGFSPLFILTSVIYAAAVIFTWVFFRKAEFQKLAAPDELEFGYEAVALDDRK